MFGNVVVFRLTIRLLLSLYIAFYAFSLEPYAKAFSLSFLAIYFTLSVINFLYPGKLVKLGNYIDVLLIPAVAASGDAKASFALIPLMIYYTNRSTSMALVFLWSHVFIYLYYAGIEGIKLLPLSFVFFLASLDVDLSYTLKKERNYIRKLRNSFFQLTKDLAQVERDITKNSNIDFLFHAIDEPTVEGYLKKIKEQFSIERIIIVAKSGPLSKESLINKEEKALYVPVKFSIGQGYVVFYVSSLFRLYDKTFVDTLEKSAKLLNLYIEGFSENTQGDSIKLAV